MEKLENQPKKTKKSGGIVFLIILIVSGGLFWLWNGKTILEKENSVLQNSIQNLDNTLNEQSGTRNDGKKVLDIINSRNNWSEIQTFVMNFKMPFLNFNEIIISDDLHISIKGETNHNKRLINLANQMTESPRISELFISNISLTHENIDFSLEFNIKQNENI